MMHDWIALLLGLDMLGLGLLFIIVVMKFKRAALPVADQVINASVISKDCRIVSMGLILTWSQVVTCFNAANHKRMTMMMAGRIVLFKMRLN
jgi:hypothetical protein